MHVLSSPRSTFSALVVIRQPLQPTTHSHNKVALRSVRFVRVTCARVCCSKPLGHVHDQQLHRFPGTGVVRVAATASRSPPRKASNGAVSQLPQVSQRRTSGGASNKVSVPIQALVKIALKVRLAKKPANWKGKQTTETGACFPRGAMCTLIMVCPFSGCLCRPLGSSGTGGKEECELEKIGHAWIGHG